MRIGALIGALLHWPLRGLARSHRDRTNIESCAVPVGAGKPANRPVQAKEMLDQLLSWQSSCRLAWVMLLSAGTLRVSHTLPPMVEPLPMVIRPSTVAPA
ncbi:hypothetical protein D3C76_655520 [compost metagenome]